MENTKTPPLNVKKWFSYFFVVVSIVTGLLVTVATLQNELRGFDLYELFEAVTRWLPLVDLLMWSLLAIITMILTSGIRIYGLLMATGHPIRFMTALRYGVLSRYYVLITPWGLGGQPIMMGIMVKDGIPFGIATSVPMLDLFFMRFSMAIITTLAFVIYSPLLDAYLFVFAIVGYFFTSFLPVVLILFSFNRRFASTVVTIIQQYWFKRTANAVAKKIDDAFDDYRKAFKLVRHHYGVMFVVIIVSFLSQIALLMVPYIVLGMFEPYFTTDALYSFDAATFVGLMAFANTILGVVPTIGSAGAAEFTFSSIFSTFITGQDLFWATFIWRFFVFYLWLLIGLGLLLFKPTPNDKKSKA